MSFHGTGETMALRIDDEYRTKEGGACYSSFDKRPRKILVIEGVINGELERISVNPYSGLQYQ